MKKEFSILCTQCSIQNTEGGAAMMISVIFFIVASVLVVLGLTGPSAREFHTANSAIASEQSYALAESSAEDAYYRFKNTLPLGPSTSLTINGNTATTAVSDFDSFTKEIVSTGNVQNLQKAVDLKIGNGTVDFLVHGWAETH